MERSALRDAIDKVAAEDRDGWSGAARSARLLELLEYRERLDAKVLRSVSEWDVQRAWAEDGACTPGASCAAATARSSIWAGAPAWSARPSGERSSTATAGAGSPAAIGRINGAT